jgi:hypothetical protein
MTQSTDLFRREALEYWSRQRGPGAVLRIGVPWVPWLYWIVLALVAAGLALTLVVRIDRTTSGPVLVDPQERTFVAVLPAAAGLGLERGRPLRLELDGPTGREAVAASALRAGAADDAAIRRAGFSSFPQPAVLVTGVLTPDAGALAETVSPRVAGRAVVVLGSEQAFSLFLRGFQGAQEGENS